MPSVPLAELFLECTDNHATPARLLLSSFEYQLYLSLPLPLGGLSRILGHLLPHFVRFQGDLVLQGRGVVGLLDGVSLIGRGNTEKQDGNFHKKDGARIRNRANLAHGISALFIGNIADIHKRRCPATEAHGITTM